MTDRSGAEGPPQEGPAPDTSPREQSPGKQPGWLQRLRAAVLPPGPAHWGWWAGGLAFGMLAMLLAFTVTRGDAGLGSGPGAGTVAGPGDRAAIEAIVKETILANPEIIPEAINRLQQMEVAKLLASNRTAIETPFEGAWAGARNPDVVLVEFFDFNCPFCRQSAADVDRLLAQDPGLRIVFRDMPVLGPDSERYALASLSAARQSRYRQFYQGVFKGQGALSQERLIRTIRSAGLDEGKVAADLGNKALREEIERNLDLGRALGLTGTPSYIVGDQILSGAVGYEALKEAVAAARKKTPTD